MASSSTEMKPNVNDDRMGQLETRLTELEKLVKTQQTEIIQLQEKSEILVKKWNEEVRSKLRDFSALDKEKVEKLALEVAGMIRQRVFESERLEECYQPILKALASVKDKDGIAEAYGDVWRKYFPSFIKACLRSFTSDQPFSYLSSSLSYFSWFGLHNNGMFISQAPEDGRNLHRILSEYYCDPDQPAVITEITKKLNYHPLALFCLASSKLRVGRERQAASLLITVLLHPKLEEMRAQYDLTDSNIEAMKHFAKKRLREIQAKARKMNTVPKELDPLIQVVLRRESKEAAAVGELKSSAAPSSSPVSVFEGVLRSLPAEVCGAYSDGIKHAFGKHIFSSCTPAATVTTTTTATTTTSAGRLSLLAAVELPAVSSRRATPHHSTDGC